VHAYRHTLNCAARTHRQNFNMFERYTNDLQASVHIMNEVECSVCKEMVSTPFYNVNLLIIMDFIIIIIISAEKRPLLDIGLPQNPPRRSVLCCPHPAASRDLHQIVGSPCGGLPTLRLQIRGRHSRTFPPPHHHHGWCANI
jgi:hypothetical protein